MLVHICIEPEIQIAGEEGRREAYVVPKSSPTHKLIWASGWAEDMMSVTWVRVRREKNGRENGSRDGIKKEKKMMKKVGRKRRSTKVMSSLYIPRLSHITCPTSLE